jgi:uncharacterized repeat protein (TIGR01451 family)
VEISVFTFQQFHFFRLEYRPPQLLRWLSGLLLCCIFQGFATAQSFPVTQNFSDTTATGSGWTLGNSAVLTGNGTIDPVGSGWLRLTDNGNSRKGYATFNTSIPTPQGVSVEFEYKTWGGTGSGGAGQKGDGFTVFMFDGNATGTFNIGDFGGSLGYANGVLDDGLTNKCTTTSNQVAGTYRGYFGLGFDEYGNYSNPADRCKTLGPGVQKERVALRGPWNYTTVAGSNGYEYLTSSADLSAPGIDTGLTDSSRPADSTYFRKVQILIEPIPASTLYRLIVKWQTAVGAAYTTILTYTMPTAPPSNLKIGFAASTGGATNYHEIRNLSIQKPTNLSVTKSLSSGFTPPLNPLAPISYTLVATNAGPNAVTDANLTDSVPSLIENVSYTCSASSGSSCSSAAGSLPGNNLNLNLSMPLGGSATVTVTGTLKATAATRTLSNTAFISLPNTSEFNDLDPNDDFSKVDTLINGFSISGLVFRDANANAFFESGLETRIITGAYRPILTGTDDLSNVIGPITATAVTPTAANQFQSYIFPNLPVGTYTLTGVSRAGLSPGEVFTTPSTLAVQITASSIINRWFGYFQGRKLSGTVFQDDGRSSTNGTSITNANNALQDSGEFGTNNVTVSVNGTLTTGGTAVTAQAKTDLQGLYTLWVPSTWAANVAVTQTLSVPTGTNQSGASIVLASGFDVSSARRIALTGQINGSVYGGLNFGWVPRNVLQPDQFGSTSSPGSVRYLHFFRPGTLGTLTLATSSSGGFNYIFYRDTNCDAVIDVGEHASPMTDTSITVDQNWPREPSGGLKACALEVEVLAPAGKAPTVVDIATITGAMVWTNNAAVTDSARVIDTTKLVGIAGNLQLFKGVRNVTQDTAGGVTTPTYKTSVGGKPGVAGTIGEELEYCISYKNAGTTSVTSMVVTDPIPFFTNFKLGSITLNGTAQANGATVSNGFITVNVGTVAAGAGGTVCYRVTIR